MDWLTKFNLLKEFDGLNVDITGRINGENGSVSFTAHSVHGISIGGDGCSSSVYGMGDTVQDAINSLWDMVTTLPSDKYLIRIDDEGKRRRYRWGKVSFQEIPKK